MTLIYNATFDKNTRKLSFEDKAGNEIYSFTVPERAPVDSVTKPLTFRATQDGSTVKLTYKGTPSGSFQTSRDGGNTWEGYTIGTSIALNTGDKVSFRAKADRTSAQSTQNYFYFVMSGKIEAWHNVMSMIRTNDFATYDTVRDYVFFRLFYGCTSLTKAPVMPAIILYNYCYRRMFSGCQSLTKAPDLPSMNLAPNCYSSMFEGCQSLTEAPELPATTLRDSCYHSMFSGCQSLTKAPVLPATTLANGCYIGMFAGCGSLNEVRCQMPSTIIAGDIPKYTGDGSDTTKPAWLSNVSSTGTFYTNADANWPSGSSGIPTGWNRVNVDSVTKPLTFRATQDGSTVSLEKLGSPYGSFQTSRDGGNTWTDYTIGTAITLNTGDEVSFRAKSNRTSEQNLSNVFYFEMTGKIEAWHNVMSMIRTNDFATYKSVMRAAFLHLFRVCTSLTKAPILPATTLDVGCYEDMFLNCQSLTKAPELPATTLSPGCYSYMFSGCQSLKEVRISATTTAGGALTGWLSGVSATGDFYCDPNATIFPSGTSGIPSGWTRRNIADYPTT